MLARKCWIFACAVSLLWLPIHCTSLQQAEPRSDTPKTESNTDRNSISLHMVGTVGNGSLQGTTMDRRLFLLGAAYNRLLTTKKFAAISFTSQLIPVAI